VDCFKEGTVVDDGKFSGMAAVHLVEDPGDPRVADFVGLNDPDLRRRRERGAGGGFFVVEGVLAIRHLLRSPYPVRSFLVSDRGLRALDGQLDAVDSPVYLAAQPVLEGIAGFHFHRGALASADRLPLPDLPTATAGAGLVVVAEGVNDHENLGALFRNAAAFGAGAVVLDPTCADPLYRRSIRVSMGHVLRLPFARAEAWPDAIADLQALGFEVIALTPSPDAEDVRRLEAGPAALPRAVLVGAEGPGLSARALAAADRRVRIPMAAGVDSLNVATAAAIALYQLTGRAS
jgi:tRNA G18 (ribose-2'-O)-methylase SpoU